MLPASGCARLASMPARRSGARSGGRASGRVPFHAPIGGVVTELAVREGAMVTPDMMVLTITELGSLWVIAEMPESQAGWVRAGTAAEIRLPSLPGETLAGRVDYVYPELSMETRTLRARIVLDGARPGLRPNMLANVTLVGEAGDAGGDDPAQRADPQRQRGPRRGRARRGSLRAAARDRGPREW